MSVQPISETISEIQGVKFFDNASSCISHFEDHWTKKAFSLIQSYGTLLSYGTDRALSLVLGRADAQIDQFTNPNKSLSKKRLIVCLHGLNSDPTQFKRIVGEIQKKELSKTDIFIPCIPQKGNAKLDEMVKPIFKKIVEWATSSHGKELVLVGISNGGRIARAIEVKIAKSVSCINIKKLTFVSIVGACKGAASVDLANKMGLPSGLSSYLMSKNISEEMPTNSRRNQRLNREWIEGLSSGPTREYIFIASPHDWLVTNYDSSLMSVDNQHARYAILPGHGHNSIVYAVGKTVAEVIFNDPVPPSVAAARL